MYIELPEPAAARLTALAARECRRPRDQVVYMVVAMLDVLWLDEVDETPPSVPSMPSTLELLTVERNV